MTGKPKSLLGLTFGKLLVLADTGKREHRKAIWKCKCSCGVEVEVRGSSLVSGNTRSCGCLSSPKAPTQPHKYYADIIAAFPQTTAADWQFITAVDTFLKHVPSNVVIMIIPPDKYNQEALIASGTCKTYAEAHRHLQTIQKAVVAMGHKTFVIYEADFRARKQQVLNFLGSMLHLTTTNIYARKCVAKAITRVEAEKFLDAEHIQGPARLSRHYFGLYDPAGTLVQVMSFGFHHRNQSIWNNPQTIILDRFAVKSNMNIPGGASKLLAMATQMFKGLGITHIVSWSDSRISSGNLYTSLGFSLHSELATDYSYYCVNESASAGYPVMKSKQSNKKSALGIAGTPTTELEYTKNILKQYRIYDCGKKVWVKEI